MQCWESKALSGTIDGVKIRGANGYVIDQFPQDVSNHRTDEYGRSVEGRSRFGLEVVNAVVDAIGAGRTAILVSPWSKSQGIPYPVQANISLLTQTLCFRYGDDRPNTLIYALRLFN